MKTENYMMMITDTSEMEEDKEALNTENESLE